LPEQEGLRTLRGRASYRPPQPREGQQVADSPEVAVSRAQRRLVEPAGRLRSVADGGALGDEQERAQRSPTTAVAVGGRRRRAHPVAGRRVGEADALADEQTSVQLTVRIRPSVEQRLRRCLYQLGEAGIRRPTRAELVEAYLAELPEALGPELDRLVERVRGFRARAPRPR